MVDTGGAQRHPADTERLKAYWRTGPGAAKIGWNSPGDFERCVNLVQAAVTDGGKPPLPDHVIKGFCATLHREATGATPGNAPGDKAGGH